MCLTECFQEVELVSILARRGSGPPGFREKNCCVVLHCPPIPIVAHGFLILAEEVVGIPLAT